jgi:DNA-binding transcriptional LysR family regulator
MTRIDGFTIKQLRYLVAVARTGSIAKAANARTISISSVREAVDLAEARLSVQLFRRTPSKGIALTQEGSRFIALAEQLLTAHDMFEHAASRIPFEWERELRLGVVRTVGPLILPALARQLSERLPQARFRFDEMSSEQVVAQVSAGTLAAGLTFNDSLTTRLSFQELMKTPPHVGLAPEHRLAKRRAIRLEELAKEPYILLEFPGARTYYTALFERHGVKPFIRYIVESREVAAELVAAGLGYSIFVMPPLPGTTEHIVRVPLRSDYWSPSFGLIYDPANAHAPMLAMLTAEIDRLRAALQPS